MRGVIMRKLSIVLLLAFVISAFSGCSPKKMTTPNEPDIMQIRSICNLATLKCYYHNVAKSVKKAGSGISHIGEVDRKFWIEYTGIATIGIDISKVNMEIEGEKVTVFMPNAKLLSIDIQESDLNEESYISSGDSWFNNNKITADDQTAAINDAQSTMVKSVESNDTLLLNARNRAQDLIENYIVQLGKLANVEYQIEWVYESDSTEDEP